MSFAERNELIETDPALVGGSDGVPARARHEANQALLVTERARLERELGEITDTTAYHGPGAAPEKGRAEEIQTKLDSLDVIEDTLLLDKDDPSKRRTLIELDLSHERAEAAIGNGDVDNADHVAVFTRGFSATVDGGLKTYDEQTFGMVEEIRNQLDDAGSDDTVAGVTWLGYQAPQSVDATTETVAKTGGAEFADFTKGIETSREGPVHVIGYAHSYGGIVGGHAAQHDSGLDDLVVAGAPSLGTDDGSELRTSNAVVYNMEGLSDDVSDLTNKRPFNTDPSTLSGVENLWVGPAQHPDGTPLRPPEGHTNYWSEDTTSQYSGAAIGAGLPQNTAERPPPPPSLYQQLTGQEAPVFGQPDPGAAGQ